MSSVRREILLGFPGAGGGAGRGGTREGAHCVRCSRPQAAAARELTNAVPPESGRPPQAIVNPSLRSGRLAILPSAPSPCAASVGGGRIDGAAGAAAGDRERLSISVALRQ